MEFSYKDDSLGDPFINDDYAREMNAATEEECVFLKNQARIVNDVLIDFSNRSALRWWTSNRVRPLGGRSLPNRAGR